LELEGITEWDKFWSKACQLTPNARYFTNGQKTVLKKYFDKGVRGESMINYIQKIKPVTTEKTINEMFVKIFEEKKKEEK
jgi:hypothetical protein